MIIHNGVDIPSLAERWDPNQRSWINITWQDFLNGRTIVSSSWILPTGWTSVKEETSQSVTDTGVSPNVTYTSTNRIYLTTTKKSGVYTVTNRVLLSGTSPLETLDRSVNIHIGDL